MLHGVERIAQLRDLVVALERGQGGVEVSLGHLLGRVGKDAQRLGGAADAVAREEEDDDGAEGHEEQDDDGQNLTPEEHHVVMLEHDQLPVCMGDRLRNNIIRCTLQVHHIILGKDHILLPFEYREVYGVRAGNALALAVDDLDGESYLAFVLIIVCFGIMGGILIEFFPDGFLHFFDGFLELVGLEHLLRSVHRLKLAVKTVDDIRGTHAADHRRDDEAKEEDGTDDEHIDEADDQDDAPGDAAGEFALLFLEDVHNG